MNKNKIIVTSLIIGIMGMNFAPVTTYALQEDNTVKTEKKLTKKEKKLLEEQQNKINYINIDWWESYNDEYLQKYILQAIANNHDIKIATLKVEEARQMAKLQFANELPQVITGASPLLMKAQNETRTTGTFAIPILASYETDIFLKNHDKTKSAKKLYEASEFQERATYLAIASQVGATYYNIVGLDRIIALQNDIIKTRKEIYDLKKLSNEEGIVSTADLVRADKEYVTAKATLFELKKAREIMLTSLCVLIGESPANSKDIKRISYNDVQNLKPVPKELSQDVILERPDYLVAQKMIEKAGIDVRVAKKEFLPTINILGLLGITGSSVTNSMSWEGSLAALGAAALLPVFTGGSRIANLKINKNKYEQSLLNYQKTNLTAIKEVNDALSTLQLDNEKYIMNVNTLKMEKQDYGFTQAKFDEGVISKMELLEKKEKMLLADKMVATSKAECLVNQISLYKAVAGKI